jgi:hypothetical protein
MKKYLAIAAAGGALAISTAPTTPDATSET